MSSENRKQFDGIVFSSLSLQIVKQKCQWRLSDVFRKARLYHYLSQNTSSKSQKIVSSIMCKFDLLPSKKLAEKGSFGGFLIVETIQGSENLPNILYKLLQTIIWYGLVSTSVLVLVETETIA